jgi:hypothetical protein
LRNPNWRRSSIRSMRRNSIGKALLHPSRIIGEGIAKMRSGEKMLVNSISKER